MAATVLSPPDCVPVPFVPVTLVGREESEGCSCFGEAQEQPLIHLESPRQKEHGAAWPAGVKTRVLREQLRRPCRWPLTVLVVSVAVAVLLLIGVVAVLARQCDCPQTGGPAPVLGCRDGWIGYRGMCYFLSQEEGSWDWSQRYCSSLGASLAVIKQQWEADFLWQLKGSVDRWLGLRRQDGRLVWVDDTIHNETFPVHGEGPCAYMSDGDGKFLSSSCSLPRRFICSASQAPLGFR